MSEQQNKWRLILESANAVCNNEIINNGSILYVDLLEERTIWHLHVELEEIVLFEEIVNTMQKVANYFYNEAKNSFVEYSRPFQKNILQKNF